MADLRSELLRIREEHGKLTAAAVLDDARQPDSPLHVAFLWDDGEAAEQYRLLQARTLIRSVKIPFRRSSGDVGHVRQFYSINRPEIAERTYEPVEDITADPLATKILLRNMERDWQALKARYETFDEFRLMVQRDLGESA
jgi:hypothetical protein